MTIHILKTALCLLFQIQTKLVVKVGAVARLVVVPVAEIDFQAVLLCHRAQRTVEHMMLL